MERQSMGTPFVRRLRTQRSMPLQPEQPLDAATSRKIGLLEPPSEAGYCFRHSRRLKRKLSSTTLAATGKAKDSTGLTSTTEPCPDCVAEDRIRREEDAANLASKRNSVSLSTRPSFADLRARPTMRSRPSAPRLRSPERRTTSERRVSRTPSTEVEHLIDDILVEHQHSLNRVITDLKNGLPGATVPDLIRYIDATANDLGLKLSPSEKPISAKRAAMKEAAQKERDRRRARVMRAKRKREPVDA